MAIKLITPEECQELNLSPYVKSVTEKTIKFNEDFNRRFIELYQQGLKPKQIFEYCRISPAILGPERINGVARRLRPYSTYDAYREAQEDNRKRAKEFSSYKDEAAYYKHQAELLKQENEFLKKTIFINQSTNER